MKGLTLEIFEHTPQTRSLSDAGLNFEYEDCDIINMTFYHINAVSEEKYGDKIYSGIFSNGSVFMSPLKIKEVRRSINLAYENGLL